MTKCKLFNKGAVDETVTIGCLVEPVEPNVFGKRVGSTTFLYLKEETSNLYPDDRVCVLVDLRTGNYDSIYKSMVTDPKYFRKLA